MNLFNNIFVFASAAVLTLSTVVSANTCTDALFRVNANPLINNDGGAYLDSLSSSNSEKYIYEKGKLVQVHYDKKETSEDVQDLFFYYDTDESALTRSGREYLITNCSAKDTLCYQQKVFDNGKPYSGSLTTKITTNYVRHETIESSGNQIQEIILKQDTVIDRTTYETSQKVSDKIYVANPDDDFRCSIIMSGRSYGQFLYKPNEKGYSISFSIGEKTSFEYFVISAQDSDAIHKTRKPVKISPKARYFDLLGRYKFTK